MNGNILQVWSYHATTVVVVDSIDRILLYSMYTDSTYILYYVLRIQSISSLFRTPSVL